MDSNTARETVPKAKFSMAAELAFTRDRRRRTRPPASSSATDDDVEEHHLNPFLTTAPSPPPRPQLRKVASRARWVEDAGAAEVVENKGKLWLTTGVTRGGKLYYNVEEIGFLAERGALVLLNDDETTIGLEDIYIRIAGGNYGCSWDTFQAYRHLKLLGYIIGRHRVPWTMKHACTSDVIGSQTSTVDSAQRFNRRVDGRCDDITKSLKEMHINGIYPSFEVYLPNSKFKKSSPGVPSFLLCLLRDKPPSRDELETVEKKFEDIPLKFCHVDNGRAILPSYILILWNIYLQVLSYLQAMAVPKVDKRMLGELEVMGFPAVRATRALHYSGNSSLEAAINWLLEHEGDPDIDEVLLVPREISIESGDPSQEARNQVQGMRDGAQERRSEERTETGRQRKSQAERGFKADEHEEEDNKRISALCMAKRVEEERARGRVRNQLQEDKRERIRAGKDLMEAKQALEENQRKRMMENRKAEQEDEKRARERIRQRIEDDKAERRRRLGLLQENPGTAVPIVSPTGYKTKHVVTAEQLRDCLRNLKKNQKDDNARVTRAFQILLKIIANIVKNPEEEKIRRIRLSNPIFKDRVGNLRGGVEFLELCGFQKLVGNGYLVMAREKVDMALLNRAGVEIASAMENPYFGLLSK